MSDVVELGKIVGIHGVRGEVRAENWAEPALWKGLNTISVGTRELKLLEARPHKIFMLLKLDEIETPAQAEALRDLVVSVPRDRIKLPEGRFLYRDIYGFSVYDLRTGTVIGTLSEVRESPASMLYVVDMEGRQVLIPAVPAFERGVDFEAGVLRVETIEGMIE